MYNRDKDMSDKLFKYIVKNISYESEDNVFEGIRLNTKSRVIQIVLKNDLFFSIGSLSYAAFIFRFKKCLEFSLLFELRL